MENKKCFSFGEISKYHLIPFLVPIFYTLAFYVMRDEIFTNESDTKTENGNEKSYNKEFQLPYFIIIFLSKIFSGILYIISKYIFNKKEAEISSQLLRTRISRRYHLNVNSKNKLKIFFI